MNNFFITGLPRTRTAWMANLFTYGDSVCFHEASTQTESVDDYIRLLTQTDAEYVGDSSSDIVAITDLLDVVFKDAPLVIIERPTHEVISSLGEHFSMSPYLLNKTLPRMATRLEALKTRPNTMAVNFRDLEDLDLIHNIWNFCIDAPFNWQRAEMLHLMRVEVHEEKYATRLADERILETSKWRTDRLNSLLN